MNLADLGWTAFFDGHFAPHRESGLVPARVARQEKTRYLLVAETRELDGEIAGRMRHEAASRSDLPAVGDWVAAHVVAGEGKAVIEAVLPRRSCFSRKEAGTRTEAQVIAANIDTVFIVCGLDGGRNFSLSRIERCLTLAWESGAKPVVVLNKADLSDDVEGRLAEVGEVAFGVPVLATSALKKEHVDELLVHLGTGKTAVLLGPSGVGKSTLINALLGEDRLRTAEVREDDRKGVHVTTWRELIVLPAGGIIIDTPGMREIQLWSDDTSVVETFPDIDTLALECRYRDCAHDTEPGCAVKAAIKAGTLDAARLESYRKQQKELRHLARKQSEKVHLDEKEKKIGKWSRDFTRHSPKRREE